MSDRVGGTREGGREEEEEERDGGSEDGRRGMEGRGGKALSQCLTVLGHPNVGKSSIINGLMGKKVWLCNFL